MTRKTSSLEISFAELLGFRPQLWRTLARELDCEQGAWKVLVSTSRLSPLQENRPSGYQKAYFETLFIRNFCLDGEQGKEPIFGSNRARKTFRVEKIGQHVTFL
jgi:hypothetical protein